MLKNTCIILIMLLIATSNLNAQKEAVIWNPVQQDSILKNELSLAKKQLYQIILQSASAIEINQKNSYTTYNLGGLQNIYLSANGFQFICNNNQTATLIFAEMIDIKLKINTIESNIQSGGFITAHKLIIGNTTLSVKKDRQYILKTILQQFIQLQKLLNDVHFNMIAFKQQVKTFNEKQLKPALTEEIRKYIIQAEAQTKLYNYQKAIALNYQIIATDAMVYSAAYLNVAILLAETNHLHSAIYNMQKFLLFQPNKEDEQFAKNKIAEWEIILNN